MSEFREVIIDGDHPLRVYVDGDTVHMNNKTESARLNRLLRQARKCYEPIASAPMDGTWIIGRDGDAVYPCAFDPDRQLWVSVVDFHLVTGVCPQEWRHLL